MKRLIGACLLAALGWAGFWFWQASAIRADLRGWFEARAEEGWQADYAAIRVRGFPSRLDVTIEEPRLGNPETGFGWQAPFLQILGLTYQPGHHILAFADEQRWQTPDGPVTVTSQGLRASVIHDPADGALLRSNAEAEVLNIAGPETALALAGLTAGLHRAESPTDQRLAIQVESVAGRDGPLTDGRLEAVAIQALLSFAEPLRLADLAGPAPMPRAIDLARAEYRVEGLELHAAGHVTVDDAGRLDGTMTLRAVNWRSLIDRARAAGMLPDSFTDAVEDALSLAAGLSGRPDTLDIPLTIDRGQMRFGMIPLGPAPRLRRD
ncbi:DUF2125 domain-containing protein [Ponticoccus sp. (in: a-proteobacteria)]|uniref:DUF2125 domain-containing protein n=1 Tax=Ponticoccus sp. (in: a-proteobacteria) TaxID=1925025 RepID=UPI003AB74D4B